MKVRAAVLHEQPGEWIVEETELDGPREGEVLVQWAAAGLCHTDEHRTTNDQPCEHLPFCGGHEGAGIVREVAPGVRSLRPGDHIVSSFIPACGHCRWCARGQANLCDDGARQNRGAQLDGTFRMHLDGEDVARGAGVGAFAEWGVLSEWSCVKIPERFDLKTAALLGCGVPTGWGSAVKGGQIQPGDAVIVMGVGGIGINAVQGAVHAGAVHVIGVDPSPFKREFALKLGATAAVETMDEAIDLLRAVTNGQGADSVIVTVGVVTGGHLAQAFHAIRKGGTVVSTAVANHAEVGIPVSLNELTLWQKRFQGSLYGLLSPWEDVPRLLRLYETGHLKLDELVTRTYSLDEITQGYADLRAGINIRGLIEYDM
jgi:S-(hydroxymethyl)glutathione dehydrogenase/alcohol dehydrogenase